MKLATLRDGTRDGQLVVVSRDLKTCHIAFPIASSLQRALDDWNFCFPQLDRLSEQLNQGKAKYPVPFNPAECMAPLPRAYQWLSAASYPSHVERVFGAQGIAIPSNYASDFLVYQGSSDDFYGAQDAAIFSDEAAGIDFGAEIIAVTDRIRMGAGPQECNQRIVLLGLANNWSLRHLMRREAEKGLGYLQSKPAVSFAPVFVTPDELGDIWSDGRASCQVEVQWNHSRYGRLVASGMVASFGQLLAHCAKTKNLNSGTIISAGTISDPHASASFGCIAEKRAVELKTSGAVQTDFMKFGDKVMIEAVNGKGQSLFGAIEQTVTLLSR